MLFIKLLYFAMGSCWASFWITLGQRYASFNLNTSLYSICPHCHQRLRAWQLWPVIGCVLQRGHCSYCHYPINLFSTIFELLTGLLFLHNLLQPALTCIAILFLSACLLTMSGTDQSAKWINPLHLLPLALCHIIFYSHPYLFDNRQRLIIAILLVIAGHFCHSLGSGDILFIACLFVFSGLFITALTILIASGAALIFHGASQRSLHSAHLPFVPWLSGALFVIMIVY